MRFLPNLLLLSLLLLSISRCFIRPHDRNSYEKKMTQNKTNNLPIEVTLKEVSRAFYTVKGDACSPSSLEINRSCITFHRDHVTSPKETMEGILCSFQEGNKTWRTLESPKGEYDYHTHTLSLPKTHFTLLENKKTLCQGSATNGKLLLLKNGIQFSSSSLKAEVEKK